MKRLLLATIAASALAFPAMAADQQNSMNRDTTQQSGGMSTNQNGGTAMDQSAPSGMQTKHSAKLDSKVIRHVQQALNKKGFDAGHVDGVWGHETVAALKNFQTKNNLKADGRLDNQTVAALGLQTEPTTTGSGGQMDRDNGSTSRMNQHGSGMSQHGSGMSQSPSTGNGMSSGSSR